MQKLAFPIALAALALASFAVYRSPSMSLSTVSAKSKADDEKSWHGQREYPPLVFTSRAWLDCSISSTKPGRQTMRTTNGQGFNFDMEMMPINDGLVKLQPPGMHYKFTAFPSGRVPAEFKGLGGGTIVEMKAEVEVDVKRYQQPKGPGTEIRFSAADINGDAAYVEFTGLFVRTSDNKPFPFRILFGSVTDGSGSVLPSNAMAEAGLMSKSVTLGSLNQPATVITAMYEAEDDVRKSK